MCNTKQKFKFSKWHLSRHFNLFYDTKENYKCIKVFKFAILKLNIQSLIYSFIDLNIHLMNTYYMPDIILDSND